MSKKNCVCIVVDRLHSGMVGAYGNSWVRTAHIDRLAAESFVFDQAMIEDPRLAAIYRGFWRASISSPILGASAAPPHEPAAGASLIRSACEAGWHTALVTDDRDVAGYSAADFAESIVVDPPAHEETAGDVSQTGMARLFDAASAWLESPPEPFLLWVHSRGMGGPWDAPLGLRNQFAEEDDPTPPDSSAVPDRMLAEDEDPDTLLGIVHAYAGQVLALDHCLGPLLARLTTPPFNSTTLVSLMSARGFPLGEHRRVGACDGALYNELVQMIWLMRFPDGLGKLDRSQALVVPGDLAGTILDWLHVERAHASLARGTTLLPIVSGEIGVVRDRVRMNSSADRALRTPAWFLRRPTSGETELYAKPGDRWEVNEVARLCPEIVAGMETALDEALGGDTSGEAAALSSALVDEID